MDYYFNMMTSMLNIENVMKTYNKSISIILSMLGFGGLFMGVFNLLYNETLTSVGYMTTSILSCILVCMIK